MNLIGDCQGGWLATIYAALRPERVNTLTIAGAPIDFHAGEPVIHEVIRRVAPDGNLRFYEGLVAMGGGVLEGRHIVSGFIMIQPAAEISRQLDRSCILTTTPMSRVTVSSRTGSNTPRQSPAPSTCGSSGTCSATTR